MSNTGMLALAERADDTKLAANSGRGALEATCLNVDVSAGGRVTVPDPAGRYVIPRRPLAADGIARSTLGRHRSAPAGMLAGAVTRR
jgi:hypothetical protein